MVVPDGLEGVVVTNTAISEIDGKLGILTYRGRPIGDLVGECRWDDLLPFLTGFAPEGAVDPVAHRVVEGDPMARLAQLLLTLPFDEEQPLRFIKTVALSLAATLNRAPDPGTGSAAGRYLTMLCGRHATPDEIHALDAYWVMAAEHSLNASTFAVRVAASTGARLPMALVAGVAALSGPLHGGAPTAVLELLRAAEEAADIRGLLAERLNRGERLMGFGHRVYRTTDPRAEALRRIYQRLESDSAMVQLAMEVESQALALLRERHPNRVLATNVEFYAGALLAALRISPDWCPATFAAARMAGWTAHYVEQRRGGRLIRPLARYVPESR